MKFKELKNKSKIGINRVGTKIENSAKLWITIIVLAVTAGAGWGFSQSDIKHIKSDVAELKGDIVPRQELDAIVVRLDASATRLEDYLRRLEQKIENK